MIKNVKRVIIIIMICTVLAFTLMSCGVDESVQTVQNMVDTEPETGDAKSQAGTEQTLTEQPEETKPENDSEMPQEALTETQEASEQTQEVSEQTQVHTPQAVSVTVSATGDCTLGNNQEQSYSGSFNYYYDTYGQDYFFDGVRDIFASDDFTLINLECVLTDETEKVEKAWNLKGKPEYAGIMTGSSVEACSLGNNHTLDYGQQSLIDTQNVLDEAGIVYGYNDIIGTYTTDEGITIGVVSANLLSQNADREEYIKNGIENLKEQGVSLIIACCHWGIEREYYPNDYQVNTAHKIIDWGADLLIGNHPHVLQGMELYNGKVICYSLGNFCFGGNKNPTDKNTAIYQQTFNFLDGQLQPDINACIIPCTLSSTQSANDFQPTVAENGKKQEIIDLMNTYSQNYSNIGFYEDGKLYVRE